jgi:hypothetical protein
MGVKESRVSPQNMVSWYAGYLKFKELREKQMLKETSLWYLFVCLRSRVAKEENNCL